MKERYTASEFKELQEKGVVNMDSKRITTNKLTPEYNKMLRDEEDKKLTEEELHGQICNYIRLKYPDVMFNTDMSGVKLFMGQAKKMKALRSNKGFPDIHLYKAKGRFHALFIEVKKHSPFKKNGELKKNEHYENQNRVMEKLKSEGYLCSFVWTIEQARELIDFYMEQPDL